MKLKYVAIFCLAIFFIAGVAAASVAPNEWVCDGKVYQQTDKGPVVVQVLSVTPAPVCNCENKPSNVTQPVIKQPASKPVQFPDITSINPVSSVSVNLGTLLSAISLPSTVTANISNGMAENLAVSWDNGTPTYNPNAAGTYVFIGRPVFSGNMTNINNVETKISVTVAAEATTQQTAVQPTVNQQTLDITSLAPVSDINVAYGTDLSLVGLPTSVTATLSDSSTQNVPVTWDNGTPTYNPNAAGTYAFLGTPTLSSNITNTKNINSSVNVVVATEATGPSLEQTASPSDSVVSYSPPTWSSLHGADSFFNFIFSFIKNIIHIFK